MAINFYYEKAVKLANKRALKLFVKNLFTKESTKLASLQYVFCTDEYLLDINRQYLKHDYYTDIISFDLSNDPKGPVTGEIYISVDRVKENAVIHAVDFELELHRVIFHGALHLCGYKDKTNAQQLQMRAKENSYLIQYGLLSSLV